MNYYEHHIGDYIKATAHLSMLEDAAYRRLIDAYYTKEAPLPSDRKACHRLARATSKPEREAVDTILHEFFTLEDDGWHNSRCDAEIAHYIAGEPEREVKKANETNRLKRHREERAELFKRITDAGQHAPWNIGINELREMVKRLDGNAPETPAPPLPETEPATPATATQSPVPNHQTPDTSKSRVVDAQPESRDDPPENATRKGALCKQLRSLGIDAAPHLQAWTELLPSYSDGEILAAAESARERKPGERLHLNYLLPILRDRKAPTKGATTNSPRQSRIDSYAAQAEAARRYHGNDNGTGGNDGIIDGEVIRVT